MVDQSAPPESAGFPPLKVETLAQALSEEQSDSDNASPEIKAAEPTEAVFSPNNLRVNKRHTRILGTLNKRATQEFINM